MKKDRVLTPEERRHWRQEVGEEPRPRSSENARSSDVENQGSGTTKLRLNALPPLAVLTGRQAQRALKPFGRAQAVLDLHGVGKLDAYSMVRDFVCTAHAQGGRHLCIITGKGRGGGNPAFRVDLQFRTTYAD